MHPFRSLFLLIPALLLFLATGCGGTSASCDRDTALRRVLKVQQLQNLAPGDPAAVEQIEAIVDSMRLSGRDACYFAAVNVLIDRLFADGRYTEADSLAVRMQQEASEAGDSLSIAMSGRVRAQMFFKLSQPDKAMAELIPAAGYISRPYRSGSDFGTATSIHEWLWIIARELGDTASMNRAGMDYARLVDDNQKINGWTDPTGHYPATALTFKACKALSEGDVALAQAMLDSAGTEILPSLPARAYEHFYTVRSGVRAARSDWEGALADADTLLSTHRDFPWFYVKDLLLKAELLDRADRHKESTHVYSDYVTFHDSLSNQLTTKRLHDLTVLYRTEIDREQRRVESLRIFAFAAVVLFLLGISVIALMHAAREKRRNRLLVERLQEYDRAVPYPAEQEDEAEEPTPIGRLDRYMREQRPYTNAALSRKELAEFAGMSQDALGQLVKNERGVSVKAYINSFRLEEARKILGSDSAEGIAEMAARLGFGTARTLQRAFKERYDMSPTQYREVSKEIEDSDNQQ